MLTKGKILLLTTLCLLSLVSFGFASWTISSDIPEEEVLGSMMAENIISTSKCVYLNTELGRNNTGIDWFDYEQTGYLNQQGTAYDDTGHIISYFNIDLNECIKYFNNKTSLKLTFTLGYASNVDTYFNIFAGHSNNDGIRKQTECEVTSSVSDEIIETTTYLNNQSLVVEIVFNDILLNYSTESDNIVNIELDYQFFASTGAYFYKNIYKYLNEDEISFELFVEITECDNGGDLR